MNQYLRDNKIIERRGQSWVKANEKNSERDRNKKQKWKADGKVKQKWKA